VSRREDLAAVLDALVAAEPDRGVAYCRAALDGTSAERDPHVLALQSFAFFMSSRFDEAAASADEALEICAVDDVLARATARAARALAQTGRPFVGGLSLGWAGTAPTEGSGGDPLLDAFRALSELDDLIVTEHRDLAVFARYLVAEAAIASARLHLAEQVLAVSGIFDPAFLERDGEPHAFGIALAILHVRVFTFRGRIDLAIDRLAHVPSSTALLTRQLRAATEILVRGNAAERVEVRALADALEAESPVPRDYLTRGCFLLAAFGLVALGDTRRAARFALIAGGDLSVSLLTTVDRALCLELLVSAAADESDPDAAEAWAALARPLLDDPIAASTAHRIVARTALLDGDPTRALQAAEQAIELARGEGRAVEAAEAEVLAARARRAAADADSGASRLIALAASAESTGHVAAQRAAVRELRASGRRLPPITGVGWNGLSAREREVAVLVAEGLRNLEIAAALHLSEHTVRAHVSRVLAAFGAASRFVVAARMAELFPGDVEPPSAPLTPQLTAVAVRVATGLGNAEIGRELGVSPKTVEKYIAEIQRRWGVGSRVAIARLVRSIPNPDE